MDPLTQETDRSGAWDSIRVALTGKTHDYTNGKLSRAITLLAIPMIMEMVMESVFAVVDIFFVSRLGKEAISAQACQSVPNKPCG